MVELKEEEKEEEEEEEEAEEEEMVNMVRGQSGRRLLTDSL